MPRGPRISYPNAVFHVINRFVDRHPFFKSARDYNDFLKIYFEEAATFGIWTYGYCLIPNHFHVVLETPSGEISRFLQRWLTRVAQEMNRRRGRTGHLFQGRSKTLLVETGTHFETVLGYVLLNRVRAGLAKNVLSDQWNSVREMLAPGKSRLSREPLWEHLFGHPFDSRRPDRHTQEVKEWLGGLDIEENRKKFRKGHRGGFLGTAEFRKRVLDKIERRKNAVGTGFRRKTDRFRKNWKWPEIHAAAESVLSSTSHQGLWRTRESALKQIRWYVAHYGAGWTWNQIRSYESGQGNKETGQAMAVSRIRRDSKRRDIADRAVQLCLSSKG